MSNIGIIMVSHGEFAKAALDSAQMIAGQQENVIAYALTLDKSLDDLEAEITQGYNTLSKKCSDVVVLCDIYGGTPFNAVSRCMLKGMNMIGFTGLSLPIVIDLLLSRDLTADEVKTKVLETHAIALSPIEVSLVEEETDLDDL